MESVKVDLKGSYLSNREDPVSQSRVGAKSLGDNPCARCSAHEERNPVSVALAKNLKFDEVYIVLLH